MPIHPLAERSLIWMVEAGEWTIDDLGQVWRHSIRCGTGQGESRTVPLRIPRRAERANENGYLVVRSLIDGRRWGTGAHRLVWQHIRGDIPPDLTINHIDGHKDHNWIGNLELATYRENTLHAHRTGLAHNPTGEQAHHAKLTDAAVAALREDRSAGMSQASAAVKYGVSLWTVSRLTNLRYRVESVCA